MAYIGTSPSNGVRKKFTYTATANQTSFSGNDDNGVSLVYVDTEYLDVYQNGVKLVAVSDYASTTGTSVVLTQGASVSDIIEIIAFDVFSVADTVSASDGGSFGGNVGVGGTLSVTGIGTFSDDIIIGDGKTIGSTSDVDAMTISSGGVVTFSQIPVFSLGGGGSFEKLASTTLTSASAGIAFDSSVVTSTYNNFYVTVAGIMPATSNADVGLYLSVDNGSNFATHLSGNHYLQLNGSSAGWQHSQNAHYFIHDGYGTAGELKISGYALIMNTNDTTAYKSIFGRAMTRNHGTNANDYAYSTYTSFASTTAVNYIIVKANSGNLQGFGTATLYGIRD